jgi:hypothetical protein
MPIVKASFCDLPEGISCVCATSKSTIFLEASTSKLCVIGMMKQLIVVITAKGNVSVDGDDH